MTLKINLLLFLIKTNWVVDYELASDDKTEVDINEAQKNWNVLFSKETPATHSLQKLADKFGKG